VPPRSVLRWCKEAAQLTRRDMGFWFVVSLFFTLCTFFSLSSFFVSSVLMLTCFLLSVCLAKLCDARHSVTFQDFTRTLRENFVLALTLSLYQLSTYFGFALVTSLVYGSFPSSLFYEMRQPPDLMTDFYNASQRLFVQPIGAMHLAIIFATLPLFTSAFHFHLMAFLGASFWQAKAKGTGEFRGDLFSINVITIVLALFAMFCASTVLLVTVPFLAPLGCSFSGALSYVAFRDIYLGRSSNVPRVASAQAAQNETTNA
jgi:hypothetical protein